MGAVPVALNTFAEPSEYEFYVRHSRARMIVGEAEFLAPIESMLERYSLRATAPRLVEAVTDASGRARRSDGVTPVAVGALDRTR